ncbi:Hypothetical predicted protein [Paramuricea clavata]|uniref:Uncharacterized protein n=1 Tax=Paramuricea clavata TaxID=317549 RepID=A0A6S7INY7_PARCT|nr:Hypothetical predicted protein [Paramuricea clavata]
MAAARILRAVVNSAVVGGVVFSGWALMKLLTPSKEQMMKRLSLDPEEHMASHKRKTAQLYATIQQNINSPDPVWQIKPLQIERTDNDMTSSDKADI